MQRASLRTGFSRRRAVVSVELALALPLLLLLLLAIAEIGLMVADSLALANACREAARAAAVGRSTSDIRAVVTASLPPAMTLPAPEVTLERRSLSGGVWSDWTALGDTMAGGLAINDAPTGAQVRVSLSYPHRLISGPLLGSALPDGILTLRTASVMLRF